MLFEILSKIISALCAYFAFVIEIERWENEGSHTSKNLSNRRFKLQSLIEYSVIISISILDKRTQVVAL